MKDFKISAKKLLIIYSAIILALGIFGATALVKNREVKAANWQMTAQIGNCTQTYCECHLEGGCELWVHSCPGQTSGVCNSNPAQQANMAYLENRSVGSILGGYSCTYVQIDMNEPGSPSTAGNQGAWTGYDTGNCGTGGGGEGGGEGGGGGQESGCPYDNTEVRFRTSQGGDWRSSGEVKCGQPLQLGASHSGQAADDVRILAFFGGNSASVQNGGTYSTQLPGEYVIRASTRNPNGGFFQEAACQDTIRFVCTQDQQTNPNFEITKVATNDDGPYEVGDLVTFRVVIKNTGDEDLTQIEYRDEFDNRYLRFVSVEGTSPSQSGVDLTSSFNREDAGNITVLSADDLTELLGDLQPGEQIVLDYTFRARSASNRACNDAFAEPKGLPEEQARACVGIIINTDL